MYRYIIFQLTLIEYSSIGYIANSDSLFGSTFQIMNMHRDLSAYSGDQGPELQCLLRVKEDLS